MEPVALGEIIQWTTADHVGCVPRDQRIGGISTDSRTLVPGELFLALKGERFDGHQYVEQALDKGACAALVDRSWGQKTGRNRDGRLLLVSSTLAALGGIAHGYRRRFRLPVVGIVGSMGKTTTREMSAAVLGRGYRVLSNRGNENNEIGVPKTLLRLGREHQAAVLELAARQPGDIAYLCSIVQPTLGVLLNIGAAHLEFFGSVEGVAKAKGELLDYLDESLLALVNFDDRVITREVKRTKGRLLGFGLRCESHFRGEGLVLDQEGCGRFSLQNCRFSLTIPGRHNVYNALAAAGIGRLLGVPWEEIRAGLEHFQPVSMRSQILRHKGFIVLNDSYNANPDSMQAALYMLRDMVGVRRIAVLGDMLELGPYSASLHARLGEQVAAAQLDLLLTVGPSSAQTVSAARAAGMNAACARHFSDREELDGCLENLLREGDIVLVKASRAMRMDEVVERLMH